MIGSSPAPVSFRGNVWGKKKGEFQQISCAYVFHSNMMFFSLKVPFKEPRIISLKKVLLELNFHILYKSDILYMKYHVTIKHCSFKAWWL